MLTWSVCGPLTDTNSCGVDSVQETLHHHPNYKNQYLKPDTFSVAFLNAGTFAEPHPLPEIRSAGTGAREADGYLPGVDWNEPQLWVVPEHFLEVCVRSQIKAVLIWARVKNRRSESFCKGTIRQNAQNEPTTLPSVVRFCKTR